MAYIGQEGKAQRAPVIKAILKKYGIKGTLSIRNHSTLVLNVKSGKIDFIKNFNESCGGKLEYTSRGFQPAVDRIQVNPYWFQDHFSGKAKQFLKEAFDALKGEDFFDESDAQVDYFHRSHYFDINIGQYNKPYVLER
jgi:hypothetical protein